MGLRPIIFNAEMVNAILEGRKTQTRRIIKSPVDAEIAIDLKCPYGTVGDTLYVREGWRVSSGYDALKPSLVKVAMGGDYVGCVDYKATPRAGDFWGRWRPSIHMPKEFSRLWLKIIDIRVERLRDISHSDSKSEGIASFADGYKDYKSANGFVGPRSSFFSLWDSINEKRGYGYFANPWVWVVEFEKIENALV